MRSDERVHEAYRYVRAELARDADRFELQMSGAGIEWRHGQPQAALARLRRILAAPMHTLEQKIEIAELLRAWGRRHEAAALLASAMAPNESVANSAAALFADSGCLAGLRAPGPLLDLAEGQPAAQLRQLFLKLLPHTWTLEDKRRLIALYPRYDDKLQGDLTANGGPLSPWDRLDDPHPTVGMLGSLALPNNTTKFLLPLLPHLRGRGMRLLYYSTCPPLPSDPVQKELAQFMDAVAWVQDLPPRQVARRVYDDRCSVLIDLDGHSYFSKTEAFMFRPAPVQVCWANWPSTLGLRTADYFLGDHYLIPPDPGLLAEMPIAMDVSAGCYTPLAEVAVDPTRLVCATAISHSAAPPIHTSSMHASCVCGRTCWCACQTRAFASCGTNAVKRPSAPTSRKNSSAVVSIPAA